MKALYVVSLSLLISGCDLQKLDQKQAPAAVAAPIKTPADNQSASIDAAKNALAEAKVNFNQAFSYIGSAQVATEKSARDKLFVNAEVELTNALNKSPDYVEALLNRGVVYMALGKLNKAEEDLKKAVALDKSNNAAQYNLACLYSVMKKVDLAADALDAALQAGFNDIERLRNDSDLAELRKSKDFRRVLDKNKIFLN